jgi:predicted outer membrane repeat protein
MNFTGNTAASDGGAIYMYGTLTIMGNVLFERNSASSKGGAIYNDSYSSGNLTFMLSDGDRAIFPYDSTITGTTDKTNGISNGRTITVDGAPGSSFELGKNVFIGANSFLATLILKGGVELILEGTIVQGSINFIEDAQHSTPLLTIVVNGFDSNTSSESAARATSGGLGGYLEAYGTDSAIFGAVTVAPKLTPSLMAGGADFKEYKYIYSYGSGKLDGFNPSTQGPDYLYDVGLKGTGEIILTTEFSETAQIISGAQAGTIAITVGSTATNVGAVEPLSWPEGMDGAALTSEGG